MPPDVGERPAVVPRAARPGSTAALPVERLVTVAFAGRRHGLVVITAGPGGGKTTALAHLRATLPADVALFDADRTADATAAAATRHVVLASAVDVASAHWLATLALRPWGRDDCLEYLVAVRRSACGSVLSRLDAALDLLDGSPQVVVAVLDVLAADPSIGSVRDALRALVWRTFPAGDGLDRLVGDDATADLAGDAGLLWRHPAVRRTAVADWAATRLAVGRTPPQLLGVSAHGHLIDDLSAAVRLRPAAVDHLHGLTTADRRSAAVPMAASILLALDPAWRPTDGGPLNLTGARLAAARWAGIKLNGASLAGADLSGADLSSVDLTDVDAEGVDLSSATLDRATLPLAKLVGASLRSADLGAAVLSEVDLTKADLTDARAVGADFDRGRFEAVTIDGADFSAASFANATLVKVDFTAACWTGAAFRKATLSGCHLEGIDLPDVDFGGADLTGSLLTGSHMPGGRFAGAKLRLTGLADVDWPGADLRGADLRGASFHLGTSRSGLLVGSTTPMLGSMTGFYADDAAVDQAYRPPEDVRHANLSGADLTGANVTDVDFFRVDLRGARYTPDQAEQFARTGAILD